MAKRKVKKKPIILILIFIILIIGLIFLLKELLKEEVINTITVYLSSDEYYINTYNLDYTDGIKIPRGTEVTFYEKEYPKLLNKKDKIDENTIYYNKILYNDIEYYIDLGYTALTYEESIKEKKLYVRTPVTVYQNSTDNKILGFYGKGTELEIVGFDKLEDGKVSMYKVKYDGYSLDDNITEGYIYSKYLVKTKEEALENYNEDGIYDTHKDRKYSYDLLGGSAANLDYYPYERVEFEDNKLLTYAKSLYMNSGVRVIENTDSYINIMKNNNLNAVVVDIKDGNLAFPSEVAKEYLGENFRYNNSKESYKEAIQKIKDAGIYVIGRIVAFNDPVFASNNSSEAIARPNGNNTTWVSAYSRKSWEYNVSLAIECVKEFGFNEIQFDYVRFPEDSYSMTDNNYNFKNHFNEEKAQAVQNFIIYASDQIHKYNAYVSVDVFGECSSTYVTAYGQYWPAISNVADVVSSMPYTDHFGKNVDTWSNPYSTIYNWAVKTASRQKEIKTPGIARTWITAYNTPYWDPVVTYNANKIKNQIDALKDAGLTGGAITWNAGSSLSKYESIAPGFND